MKFSMNGFRRQLSGDVQDLRDLIKAVIDDEWYDKDDLVDNINKIITASNVVNCVYQDGDKDFSDISDIEVEHLEISQHTEGSK